MKCKSLRIPVAIVLSLICFLFSSAYGRSGSAGSIHIDERTDQAILEREFKIKYGQELPVQGQDLKVKFAALLSDSRCPANVQCVWEGDAEIQLVVRLATTLKGKIRLHTSQRFTQAKKYRQYVIRLIALEPSPRTGEAKPNDYTATLLITKK